MSERLVLDKQHHYGAYEYVHTYRIDLILSCRIPICTTFMLGMSLYEIGLRHKVPCSINISTVV